jgi:hypothetical protein
MEREKSNSEPQSARHDKARQLAEDALGAYARGDHKEGDRLAEEAKRLDRSAVEEVVEDLDEDAGSDPNAAAKA